MRPAQRNNKQLLELLIQAGATANITNHVGVTPLHYANESDDPEIIQILLDAGVEIDKTDPDGHTALSIAVLKNNFEHVKLLYENGANISHKPRAGESILHLAALMGHFGLVLYLLQKGIDVNTTNDKGQTPMHTVVRLCENNISLTITMLVRNGANINQRDNENKTPLDYAFQDSNMDTIKALLKNGAIVSDNRMKQSIMQIAKNLGMDDVLTLLEANNTPLQSLSVFSASPQSEGPNPTESEEDKPSP